MGSSALAEIFGSRVSGWLSRPTSAISTGAKEAAATLPTHYGYGDVDEGVLCAFENQRAWQATLGALEWLAARTTYRIDGAA